MAIETTQAPLPTSLVSAAHHCQLLLCSLISLEVYAAPSPQLQPRWGWGGKGARRNKPVRRKTTSDASPGLGLVGQQHRPSHPLPLTLAKHHCFPSHRETRCPHGSHPVRAIMGVLCQGHRLGLKLHSNQSAHSTCSSVFFSKLQSNSAMGINPPHQPIRTQEGTRLPCLACRT